MRRTSATKLLPAGQPLAEMCCDGCGKPGVVVICIQGTPDFGVSEHAYCWGCAVPSGSLSWLVAQAEKPKHKGPPK